MEFQEAAEQMITKHVIVINNYGNGGEYGYDEIERFVAASFKEALEMAAKYLAALTINWQYNYSLEYYTQYELTLNIENKPVFFTSNQMNWRDISDSEITKHPLYIQEKERQKLEKEKKEKEIKARAERTRREQEYATYLRVKASLENNQ